jgi:hypothetical protein
MDMKKMGAANLPQINGQVKTQVVRQCREIRRAFQSTDLETYCCAPEQKAPDTRVSRGEISVLLKWWEFHHRFGTRMENFNISQLL